MWDITSYNKALHDFYKPPNVNKVKVKVKPFLFMPITGPKAYRQLRPTDFLNNRYMKVVKLSAARTGRIYPPPPPSYASGYSENIPFPLPNSYKTFTLHIKDFKGNLTAVSEWTVCFLEGHYEKLLSVRTSCPPTPEEG